jgi:NADPH-dependent glutamate synthase beta subunit-like oxidoreductase/NAD-dependent dihydropyrimidine dehydrogenase PreA subunit
MKKPKDRLHRVAIIGATPSGVTAANKLGELGIPVTLIDAAIDLDAKFSRDDWMLKSGLRLNYAHRPGLIRILRNPDIRLHMPARVDAVKHSSQGFSIKITRPQTFVDMEKCTLCGRCYDSCPVKLDAGRKAILYNGRQSLPGRVVIEKRGDPPCQKECPLGVNAQGYIALCGDEKYAEALDLIRQDNVLPGICGRICTHPCETACRRAELDEAIAIRDIKRFIADTAATAAAPVKTQAAHDAPGIAVIGSGPAGLAAAAELARAGCGVTVYEKEPLPGGLLRYGVGRYRLPEDILDRDIGYIKSLGVNFICNHPVDVSLELETMAKKHSGVIVATGTRLDRKLGVEGEGLAGVEGCLSFLNRLYRGEVKELQGRAAVIGDGNSAFDLARALCRLGAEVTLISWFSQDAIPADADEVKAAIEEGVSIQASCQVTAFEGSGGTLRSLKCAATKPGPPDAGGTAWPVIDPKKPGCTRSFDRAFVAIGQSGPLKQQDAHGRLHVTKNGFIEIDAQQRTNLHGVYAAGDGVSGPTSVVASMASGRSAARGLLSHIHRDGASLDKPVRPADRDFDALPVSAQKTARPVMAELQPAVRRSTFLETALGFTREQVMAEAQRCLQCGICSQCLQCSAVCSAVGAIQHDQEAEVFTENAGIVIIADRDAAGQINGDDVIRAYDGKSSKEDVYALMARGFAAAAKAMVLLGGSGARPRGHGMTFSVPDPGLSPDIRIGVFACRCNDSLGWIDSMTQYVESLATRPDIVHAEILTAACVPDGYSSIVRTIREKGITRAVLASCVCCSLNFVCSSCTEQRSRLKNKLFTGTGVSRSMVEPCNLRGEVLRLVKSSPETAQDRFESLMDSSLNRARRLKLLPSPSRNYSFTTAVIGDSAAARQSALTLAGMGFEVLLFAPQQDSDEPRVTHANIHRFPGATVHEINGARGDFHISFQMGAQDSQTIQAGAVILGGRQARKLTCIHQKELPGRAISSVMQQKGVTGISFLYPGATSVPGVYMADFPGVKLSEREKGAAAAVQAAAGMPRGPRASRGFTVCIDEELCRGCGRCVRHCPYQAITLGPGISGAWRAAVDDALCKGCGNCISVCPSNAADSPYRNQAFLERALGELLLER